MANKNLFTRHLENLCKKYPSLTECCTSIQAAYNILIKTVHKKGTIIVCGNGGSAADSEHIVGELMKGFLKRRPIEKSLQQRLVDAFPEIGGTLADNLQSPITAISLTCHQSLTTAFNNDVSADLTFAQQLLGYGKQGDSLLAISTSGNAKNVINAAILARVLEINVIGLTGASGGKLKKLCDVCISVPESSTPSIQELHLPVYHTLCAMIEAHFFSV